MFSGADSFNQPLNDWNVSNDVTSMAVRRNEPRVIELPDDDVEFDSDFGWRKNHWQRPTVTSTPPPQGDVLVIRDFRFIRNFVRFVAVRFDVSEFRSPLARFAR